jgi:hypothetical protein
MGKRSDFERRERDFYPTPAVAVAPLLPHIEGLRSFVEPCAGAGDLIDHMEAHGLECRNAFDIEPLRADVHAADARGILFCRGDCFITNPPWRRDVLHELIVHLSDIAPTWLLFDADWVHTRQAAPYLPRLRKIVAVGRVKWIPDSKFTGKDNCAWHLFTKPSAEPAVFYGRAEPSTGRLDTQNQDFAA